MKLFEYGNEYIMPKEYEDKKAREDLFKELGFTDVEVKMLFSNFENIFKDLKEYYQGKKV